MNTIRTTRTLRPVLGSVLALLLVAAPIGGTDARAGAFIFAGETNGTGVVTHPQGYDGTGGAISVSVCIDPTSANAADMEIPVQNAIKAWNELIAVSPNLLFDGDNNVPAGMNDFESAVVHELGHCIGLAHPNLATESGLAGANRDYTKTTDGANDSFDLTIGADAIRGSADDSRGDDVNLHWYVDADNDPCTTTVGTSDNGTMSRGLGNLPAGDNFAANADRTVCNALGFPNTEAAMQQGQGADEDQRDLGGDDVRTLRFAMSGLDEDEGTGDDYTLTLTYAGLTTACDIPIDFDNSQTGFAVCSTTGNFLDGGPHIEIDTANIFYNTGGNWFFNDVLESEPPVCDAGGPYVVECEGTTTEIALDASGSSDPEDGTDLTYEWTTDCPGGSFDDDTSATPTLTVDSTGCSTSCSVEVTVTDTGNLGTTCSTSVDVVDTTAPTIACPTDVTIECDEPTDPTNTGTGLASDVCDPNPAESFSDVVIPGDCPQEFTIDRTWTGTDHCGLQGSCGQSIEVEDTTPPTIEVTLTPDVLWPPNHKMWTVEATIETSDNCDGDPDVTLISVVSNEPDDDQTGDGSTTGDIQDADIGTDDREIRLRAEREGDKTGRIYTVTYRADDGCGNTTDDSAEVRVPHDRNSDAFAEEGFTPDGTDLLPGVTHFSVVIPSSATFDATTIDVETAFAGNYLGVQTPVDFRFLLRESNGGRMDLMLIYDAEHTRGVKEETVGIHFRLANGTDYVVPNVFGLTPVPDPSDEITVENDNTGGGLGLR